MSLPKPTGFNVIVMMGQSPRHLTLLDTVTSAPLLVSSFLLASITGSSGEEKDTTVVAGDNSRQLVLAMSQVALSPGCSAPGSCDTCLGT